MYDYSDYATVAEAQQMSPVSIILGLIVIVISIVAMWKIFTKAGKPGWAAIVPFYNLYTLFEIAWGKGILFLLTLIPVVNFIVLIIVYIKLAKAFGKGTGFGLGLVFLSLIFQLILAFGPAQYIGPDGVAAAPAAPAPEAPAYQPPTDEQ